MYIINDVLYENVNFPVILLIVMEKLESFVNAFKTDISVLAL